MSSKAREPHCASLPHSRPVGNTMPQFLVASAVIDSDHPRVVAKARELALGRDDDEAIARACFAFVRDEIQHSWDFRRNPVTCKASDVLLHGTGYCYAKSHLLAALLRANSIPAGLCYQRLAVGTQGPPYCLHGLNAVYLRRHGWYRIDARGNRDAISAQFTPPTEALAFPIVGPLEQDFEQIWAQPLPVVIDALTKYRTVEEVYANLPDVEPCELLRA